MKLQVFVNRDEQWQVRIVGDNGEKVMLSEAYFSKSNATRAARKVSNATGWPVSIKEPGSRVFVDFI